LEGRILLNYLIASAFALIFLLLYWIRGRKTSGWLPLNSFKTRLLVYGVVFVLGEAYLMVVFADLKWPRPLLFLAIASWGVLLSPGPWNRQYTRESAKRQSPD
jgi:hypothetical protein